MVKKILIYAFLAFMIFVNIVLDANIANYFKVINEVFRKNIVLDNKLNFIICLIIAIISILIVLDVFLILHKRNDETKGIKIKKEDGTFGTADWMSKEEMERVLSIDDKPGIILGKYNNDFVKLPFDSYFNKNMCVFGSSGSMKTIGFVLTNLLELSKYRKSIISTDSKRRNIS